MKIEADPETAGQTIEALEAKHAAAEAARLARVCWDTTAEAEHRMDVRNVLGLDPDDLDAAMARHGLDRTKVADALQRRNRPKTDLASRGESLLEPESDLPSCTCSQKIPLAHRDTPGREKLTRVDGWCRHCPRCGPRLVERRTEAFRKAIGSAGLSRNGWVLVIVPKADASAFSSWLNTTRKRRQIMGVVVAHDVDGARSHLLNLDHLAPPKRFTVRPIADVIAAHREQMERSHALVIQERPERGGMGRKIGRTEVVGGLQEFYTLEQIREEASGEWRSLGLAMGADETTDAEKVAKVKALGGRVLKHTADDLEVLVPPEMLAEWRRFVGVVTHEEMSEARAKARERHAWQDQHADADCYAEPF